MEWGILGRFSAVLWVLKWMLSQKGGGFLVCWRFTTQTPIFIPQVLSWYAISSSPPPTPPTADALHDVASGLEMITPLCPQQFLPVAGIANLAKARIYLFQ